MEITPSYRSRKGESVGGAERELPGQESWCSASPFTAGSYTASSQHSGG